ncbi:MAG: CNNM domain-containing protein [Kiritimatiellia bacterium]
MTGVLLLVAALVVALALAAFCAGAETGFTSVSRGRILHMAREGSAAAKIVHAALSDLSYTLTALLVGNNLGSVLFSSASAALATRLFAGSVAAQAVWGFCAACVMLALGEFLPKLLCSARPLRRTLRLAPAFRVFNCLFAPLTSPAMAVTGLFAPRARSRERVTPDELLRILQDRKDGVSLTDFESALIARILVLRVKGVPVTAESLLSAIDDAD